MSQRLKRPCPVFEQFNMEIGVLDGADEMREFERKVKRRRLAK